jgi:RimJ/RimL family protein N-acetyltransferase
VTALSRPVLDAALRFELCRDGDVPALMRFIGTEWRAGHVLSCDESLLRWQFSPELLHGRHARGPTVMLAWLDNTIVGMLGLTGFDLNVFGGKVQGVWLSHWFAGPAYRGHNVALRLMWAARDLGVEVVGTLGSNVLSTKLLARLGLEVIPILPRWVGVFHVERAVELVCAANPGLSTAEASELCSRCLVTPPEAIVSSDGFRSVGWNAATAAAWDEFWNSALAQQLVGANRDARYLTWRYVMHPRFQYHMHCARRESDGVVEGIVVFRLEQVRGRATQVLRIVEFLATPAAQPTLVRAVLDEARACGAAVGDFYCSSVQVAKAFARVGFQREDVSSAGAVLPARLQPLEAGHFPMTTLLRLPGAWRGRLRELVDDGRLYITKSDGDQDRPN